ncbi:hypothetical protein M231_03078 [Tremella mesenterica]|uniref:Uncharacterized protein n=1 Tax=Tremella mesenterica TaxID=5217 RepID=A0A4Q1BNW6_TREME|nr:hypothetical protein M231_03078 [Tremella mesenterica]
MSSTMTAQVITCNATWTVSPTKQTVGLVHGISTQKGFKPYKSVPVTEPTIPYDLAETESVSSEEASSNESDGSTESATPSIMSKLKRRESVFNQHGLTARQIVRNYLDTVSHYAEDRGLDATYLNHLNYSWRKFETLFTQLGYDPEEFICPQETEDAMTSFIRLLAEIALSFDGDAWSNHPAKLIEYTRLSDHEARRGMSRLSQCLTSLGEINLMEVVGEPKRWSGAVLGEYIYLDIEGKWEDEAVVQLE